MYKARINNKRLAMAGLLISVICATGCSTEQKIGRMLKRSAVLQQHHVGFALYDLAKNEAVFRKNADLHFTPASNTKLLTFYASLKLIGDSIPGLRYVEQGDSLIFWGTGDPALLQTRLQSDRVIHFLRTSPKKLFFAAGRYTGDFYGRGWQWDDYNDDYQAEINELPILDNLVCLKTENGVLTTSPALFTDCLFKDSLSRDTSFKVTRAFNANHFSYPPLVPPKDYLQRVPYKVSTATTLALLSQICGKPVELLERKMPEQARVLYSSKRDAVLKEMMLPSDNFIAEQLLLVCADRAGLEMNAAKLMNFVQEKYLAGLPDKLVWVDGSGLSRYNLNTPENLVKLLEMIYKEVGDPNRLYAMLAAGGMSGTLKNAYPKTTDPFVFGKTGTLSNNHSQSGYVLTKKHKTYAFSFMNNNFVSPTAAVRKEIEKIITYVHERL